ncbi:hypothetical protein HNW77_03405 [Komagataeibacter sp. AV436]|uniref:DUF1134 domain-containing protein n=1 Tax=Komagataeibacter melomenusus TaxID=2766578 RepID=A0ABX2AAW1_9PROT|nr:hypothetical protein [Komagataeibacter melomenusus]MBV1829189.1 hypothetical protein [Komagataeibacter melomenusus]NPC65472.1 hypothetical protein [Komagataeibacter melomenusus]
MNRLWHTGLVALASSLALHGTAQATCAATDARIELSAHHVAVGVGYVWGQGTLYDGTHAYPFTIKGGGIPSVGGMALSGQGCVRNLGRLQDFNGTYWSVGGTATIHHGTAGLVMENGRGVDINLAARTRGALLSGQVARLSFRLKGGL